MEPSQQLNRLSDDNRTPAWLKKSTLELWLCGKVLNIQCQIIFCRLNGKNYTKFASPCSVRATWWQCCVGVALWDVSR